MEALQILSRNDMKKIKGGYICTCRHNDCDVTLTQGSSGWILETCDGEWFGDGAYGGTVCAGECPSRV